MTPKLLLLALLPLVGCLSETLWDPGRDAIDLIDRGELTLAVERIGLAPGEPGPKPVVVFDAGPGGVDAPAPQLAVQVGAGRGRIALLPWCRNPAQPFYLLAFDDHDHAPALAALLTEQALGPIDDCAIELEWTMDANQIACCKGRVTLRGTYAPALRDCGMDADVARALLASASALPADATEDPELQQCAAAAARLDWRTLLPLLANGEGRAIAFLPRAGATASAARLTELDVVVRVGGDGDERFLRVPAAAVPVLAAVGHDPSTLGPRFCFTGGCHPRALAALDLDLQPLGCRAALRLVTRIEARGHSYGWFARDVLIPLTDAIDSVLRFVWHLLVGQTPEEQVLPPPPRRR